MSLRLHPLLLGLLSGALLSASYRLPGFWPLAFVALLPLLFVAYSSARPWTVFLSGALAGVILVGVAVSEMFTVLPLPAEFAPVHPLLGFLFVFLNWLVVALVMGFLMGVWLVLIRRFDLSRVLDVGAVAVLFCASEYLRMVAFNIFMFSPTVSNGLFFSPGFIGYALADSESFRQFAAVGGVYTLSFIVVLANLLLYRAYRFSKNRKLRQLRIVGIGAAIVLITFLPIADTHAWLSGPASSSISLGIIALYEPSASADSVPNNQQVEGLVKQAGEAGADAILLPEDTRLLWPISNVTYPAAFGTGFQPVIIDSGAVETDGGRLVMRAYADNSLAAQGIRDKEYLTPDGEYLTSLFRFLVLLAGGEKQVNLFEQSHDYTTGSDGQAFVAPNGVRASVMFCLEVLRPEFSAELVREQGSQLLLVPASHALFHPSPSLERDILRFNQVQAVEADVPLASSVNGAPAYALDEYGNVIAETGQGGVPGFSVVSIPLKSSP